MADRRNLSRTAGNVNAARRALGRALRRPRTYRSAAKELMWAGVNLAMYPAGVLSEALEDSGNVSLAGRYSSQLPLRYLDPEAASTPVILVHGYFHNRSAFLIVRRALRRAGFRTVSTLNYNVIGHNVEELAAQLGAHVERVWHETGAHRVHIIGHSLGGIVARAYIQLHGGDQTVHTCITLGSPHGGTYSAYAGRGRAARDMRPGSEFMTRLEAAPPTQVRFVSYYSNLDAMIIPAASAKLTVPGMNARNVLVRDLGHMSLLISQPLIASILDTLRDLDGPDASVTPIARGRRTRRAGAAGA